MEEYEVVDAVKKHLETFPDVSKTSGEYTFVKNGCVSDVIGYSNQKIKYIVECKGSGSPGTIAGGIGQAFQYAFQKKKDKNVATDSVVFFACPEDRRRFLDKMQIPSEIKKILLVNKNKQVTYYVKSKNKREENILQIEGTVYLEQFTIKGFICAMKTLASLGENEHKKAIFEKKYLENIKEHKITITDARNVLIGPRNLGLVNNFKLTPKGYFLYAVYEESYDEFMKELLKLIYPSLMVVLNGFILHINKTGQKLSEFKYTLEEIEKEICNFYDASEVIYFQKRRLTYPINILQEIKIIEKCSDKKGHYKINKIVGF